MAQKNQDTIDEVKGYVKDISNGVSHVVSERIFRPLYFYFIIAWSITNWKFLYTFLFANEKSIIEQKGIMKVEFLSNFYQFNTNHEIFISLLMLIVIPAVSTFVVIWWLSKLSALAVQKNEEHNQEIKSIKRKILYKDKVDYAKEQRQIRDAESDKKDIRYEDNDDFNEDYDAASDDINIAGTNLKASEVLYNNDYDLYVEALREFREKKDD